MVEHRVAGSWLGATCIALGWRWTSSEGPLIGTCLLVQSLRTEPPDDILVREGGAEWLPGRWGRTRHLFLNQPLVGRPGTGTAARGVPSGSGKTKRPVSGGIPGGMLVKSCWQSQPCWGC